MNSVMSRIIYSGIVLFGLLATISAGLAAQNAAQNLAPAWMNDLDGVYVPSRYLAFLGNGTDLDSARSDALTQFSRFFGVNVDVLTEGSKFLAADANGEKLETKLAETVKIRSNQDLFAVRYSDPFRTDKGVWIVAFSTKRELADNLAETAHDLGDRLKEVLDALKISENGAVRLARAATANALMNQIDTVLKKLSLVDTDQGRDLKKTIPLDKAFNAWDTAKRTVRFNVALDGDNDGRQTDKVRSLLSAEGFSTDPKGAVSVKGRLAFKDVTMIEGLQTVEWTFVLSLGDEKGNELVVSQKTGRKTGTSRDSAILQANMEFEKFARNDFLPAFHNYLASKVLPE